jgi:hypothetical protein
MRAWSAVRGSTIKARPSRLSSFYRSSNSQVIPCGISIYATAQNRFYAGAYVNNAFNKTALSFSFGAPFSAFMTGTLQAPRVFGIRTGVHF